MLRLKEPRSEPRISRLTARLKTMSIAAEMDLAPSRGVTREHIRNGSVTEEQRRIGAKDTPPVRVEPEIGHSRCCSSLTDPLGICAVVAPSDWPISDSTAMLIVFKRAVRRNPFRVHNGMGLLTQGRRSSLAPTRGSVTERRWRSMQSLRSSDPLEAMETIYSRQCLACDKDRRSFSGTEERQVRCRR